MAYYGIQSAAAVTASVGNDTVEIANLGGTTITAASVYGQDGNDIISLGAVGKVVTGSATMSGVLASGDTLSGDLQAHVVASATHSAALSFVISDSGAFTTGISLATAVTSQQAARIVNGAYLQGNAGNDSIAFGEAITRVSATTFAGGRHDLIGSTRTSVTASSRPPTALLWCPPTSKVAVETTRFTRQQQFSGINISNKAKTRLNSSRNA